MRIEKDDRYMSEPPKKTPASLLKSPNLHGLSKTKLVVLGLIIAIILVVLGLIIFSSQNRKPTTTILPAATNNSEQVTNDQSLEYSSSVGDKASATNNGNNENSANSAIDTAAPTTNAPAQNSGTTISPMPISRTPTETQYQKPQMQERLEIPDEVTEQLNNPRAQSVAPEVKPKVVHPPVTTKPKTTHSTTSTSNKIADNHFSIQLNASTSAESLKTFVKKNQITNYQIYETKRNNKPWFVLIKGSYATSKEARDAIKALPSELQKNSPWIKSGATINKEKAAK